MGEEFKCTCGRVCKNFVGLQSHRRSCTVVKRLLVGQSTQPMLPSVSTQPVLPASQVIVASPPLASAPLVAASIELVVDRSTSADCITSKFTNKNLQSNSNTVNLNLINNDINNRVNNNLSNCNLSPDRDENTALDHLLHHYPYPTKNDSCPPGSAS